MVDMELAEICVFVGFCKSKSEARRVIESGAIRLDGKKITEPKARLFINKQLNKYYIYV